MDGDLFIKVGTNGYYTFGAFAILSIIFHIIFLWIYRPSKVGWKKFDYVVIGFATLGLISASSDVRRWRATNMLDSASSRAKFAFIQLRDTVIRLHPSYICFKFMRTENSPKNFDEMQHQYEVTCEWYRTLGASLPKEVEPDFPTLNTPDPPKGIDTPTLTDSIRTTLELFRDYEVRRKERQELVEQTKRGEGEISAYVLSPFLLVIALALRFTKVTGEIRLEKQRNKPVI